MGDVAESCQARSEERKAVHNAALAAATQLTPSRVRRRRNPVPEAAQSPHPSASGTGALHTFDSLPEYLQDNEFIQTGYRYDLPVKDTLRSLFNLHNETGNVWSHLIGFLLFVALTIWVSRSPPAPLLLARPQVEELWHGLQDHLHALQAGRWPRLAQLQDSVKGGVHALSESVHLLQDTLHGSWQQGVHSLQESVHSLQEGAHVLAHQLQHGLDVLLHPASRPEALLASLSTNVQWPTARWPMYVFCAGAMTCLLLSAACHLFGCCKRHIALVIWRLDYAGIALLIVTSFFPIVYYAFLCQPAFTATYLAVISVLGAAAISMSLLEVFQAPQWRSTRAALYVGLGAMGVVPLIHVMALHGGMWHVQRVVALDVAMGACYIGGAVVYALRIPERWFPGKFDILLHSHQIFHLCVVLGALTHFKAAMLLLEWRDASGGCAAPLTRGPLRHVLSELSAHGQELLRVDQAWEWLRAAVAQHLSLHGPLHQAVQNALAPGVAHALPALQPEAGL